MGIVCGIGHSAAVLPDGTVRLWGFNQFGQTDAPAGTYAMLTAGQGHTVGIRGYSVSSGTPGEPDVNQNGIHDRCECLADLTGDRQVNFVDLLLVINAWGPVELGTVGDVDGDGVVQFNDLLVVLDAFSPPMPTVQMFEHRVWHHGGCGWRWSGSVQRLVDCAGSRCPKPRQPSSI